MREGTGVLATDTKDGDRIKRGPFTWERKDNGDDECWNLVTRPDLPTTHWSVKNYGGKPDPENSFSGWRLVSGGPFTRVGGWTTREDAIAGVTPWLIERYKTEAKELAAKAQRTLKAIAKLKKELA